MYKVTSFVLKIASRCNLNCSYCYMYNMGDQTYLKQPKFMALETVQNFADRLKSYCENADIKYVQIVFHGGEPLLLKPDYFEKCVTIFKNTAPALEFVFTVQTNGVTLDQDWYSIFKKNNISVGISIDGPKKYHDEYRVFHNGKGSYNKVAKAVQLGKNNNLAGLLLVVNINIPVKELYAEIKHLDVSSLNLLLPDGHYDQAPLGLDENRWNDKHYTPYADWFIDLYKLWKNDKERSKIYFFETLIKMVMGEEGIGNQLIGRRTNGVVVVESDGSIEVVDSLRACFEGITRNEINVYKNNLEDLFEDKTFQIYYRAHDNVAEQCLNCPVFDICGGGFLGHRYSNENGFDNPTMYCKDMVRLISFIQNDILNSLPEDVVQQLNIEELKYEDIINGFEQENNVKINPEVQEELASFKKEIHV
ncbi:radical SAM protein [Aquimarina sp. AD10]|uniref:radical SAM protein n=2 Tax=Aquimarina sp. AD10 TaxID=1714849 RepID=UPI000E49B745|nr:radical SAM protein [Aquimarina sp. AD10]AXT62760.1 radical SAM protein [Aquimarina sp. AD10]RKN01944.1 radical SAM protein [Aquimarina sp. AD10]